MPKPATTDFAVNGQSIDSDDLAHKLYLKAIELLARREHSAAELATKLRQRFAADDELEALIPALLARLQDSGYQSDQRFAESYTRARSSIGFGQKRIALELHQKGIHSDVAKAALAEVFEAGTFDELAQLESLWQKKFGLLPPDAKVRAKQMRFLAGRGFSFDQIQRLYERLKPD